MRIAMCAESRQCTASRACNRGRLGRVVAAAPWGGRMVRQVGVLVAVIAIVAGCSAGSGTADTPSATPAVVSPDVPSAEPASTEAGSPEPEASATASATDAASPSTSPDASPAGSPAASPTSEPEPSAMPSLAPSVAPTATPDLAFAGCPASDPAIHRALGAMDRSLVVGGHALGYDGTVHVWTRAGSDLGSDEIPGYAFLDLHMDPVVVDAGGRIDVRERGAVLTELRGANAVPYAGFAFDGLPEYRGPEPRYLVSGVAGGAGWIRAPARRGTWVVELLPTWQSTCFGGD